MARFEEALSALRDGKLVALANTANYYHINPLGDLMVSWPLGAAAVGKPLRGDYACSGFTSWQVLSRDWVIFDSPPWLSTK